MTIPEFDNTSAEVSQEPAPPQNKMRVKIFRWLALVFVAAITIAIILLASEIEAFTEQIPALGWLAYPAIFGISIIANATVLIPIPGVALTTAFGSIFNPFAVAIAAGLGASFGELSGYLAGFSGQGIVERTKWHDRLESWMKKMEIGPF